MQHLRYLIVLLSVGCLPQAFAADPPTPSEPSAHAATAEATPASPATTAASAPVAATPAPSASDADAAAAAAKKADEAQAKRLRSLGYRPEERNGHTIYCKKEALIGSLLPTKTCADGDAIEAAARQNKENLYSAPRAMQGQGQSK
jgi:hypothetical protein